MNIVISIDKNSVTTSTVGSPSEAAELHTEILRKAYIKRGISINFSNVVIHNFIISTAQLVGSKSKPFKIESKISEGECVHKTWNGEELINSTKEIL